MSATTRPVVSAANASMYASSSLGVIGASLWAPNVRSEGREAGLPAKRPSRLRG